MIYYLRIVLLMLTKTTNWYSALFVKKVILKNGLIFNIRNFIDWYIIIETVVLDCYRYNKKEDAVIDIGAAFGDFSIFAAKKASHVYSIEPEPSSYDLLLKNINNNQIKNIRTYPIALSSTAKSIKLSIDNSNHNHSNAFNKHNSINIKAMTLSEFINKNVTESNIYIKCDCEGGEYDIFKNIPKGVFNKIDKISMEYHIFTDEHKTQFNVLKNTFIDNDFKVKISSNPIHNNIGFLFATRS